MTAMAAGGARDRLATALERLRATGDPAVFTRLYVDDASRAAEAADARAKAGLGLGPLDGMIVSVKDLFDVAGDVTTAGSAILRDAQPATADATAIRRLREAGAVILGKTNMTEFAYSGLGLNPHWGTPRNARSPGRIPGGSSSGAGVSVATGIVDLAIGSDTGGSIRIPASLNGVVGFKPTASRLPMGGVFPLSPSLDSIGPLAASVQTCSDADAVMAGDRPAALPSASLNGARIGIVEDLPFDIEPAIAAAFERVLSTLRTAGATLMHAPIADLVARRAEILRDAPIVPVEAFRVHAKRIRDHRDRFDPNVLHKLCRGAAVSQAAYERSLRQRERLAVAMDERLSPYRCIVLPTTTMVAPLFSQVAGQEEFRRADDRLLALPGIANFFDLCAVSLPMPIDPLPAGISVIGRRGRDVETLIAAKSLETALGP